MPANSAHYVAETWRAGDVLAHLVVPAWLVTRDPVLEPVAERAGVEALGLRLPLEERPDFFQGDVHVFGQAEEVVQIPALQALDDAAQLLGSDLIQG